MATIPSKQKAALSNQVTTRKAYFRSSAKMRHITGINKFPFSFSKSEIEFTINKGEIFADIEVDMKESDYEILLSLNNPESTQKNNLEDTFSELIEKYKINDNLAFETGCLLLYRYNEITDIPEKNILRWSLDKDMWWPVKLKKLFFKVGPAYLDNFERSRENIETDLNTINKFPLSFLLIREAFSLADKNINSAAVLAATALEKGCKEYWFHKSPGMEKIYWNTQIPEMSGLLQFAFPDMEERFEIGEKTINIIKTFLIDRNKLIHRGLVDHKKNVLKLEFKKAIVGIELIEDVLYYFRFLEGNEWAREYIKNKSEFKFEKA